MAEKKRILFVSHEMDPFLQLTEIADIARLLPQYINNSNDTEVRILMPRFSSINERRHRLHEVVRLSGINIIIAEDDFPLIIKVASMPNSRVQVYFLDNEDFFRTKNPFADDEGNMYDNNAERMIFFCKGVLETVKKFGWAPDIIYCQGWLTSLLPLYVKVAYKTDPIFTNTLVVYAVYPNSFEGTLNPEFAQKALIRKVEEDDLKPYGTTSNTDLNLGAIYYADALVIGNPNIEPSVEEAIAASQKPVMTHPIEVAQLSEYKTFFSNLLEQNKPVLS